MNRYNQQASFVPPYADDEVDADFRPIEGSAPLAAQAPQTPTVDAAPIVPAKLDSRSFTSVQGKPVDFYAATERKFVLVVIVVGVTLAALFFTAWLDGYINGLVAGSGWVVLTGVAGLVTFILLNHQDMGVMPERTVQKRDKAAIDAWRDVNVARTDAQRDVALHAIDRHYDYLEGKERERIHDATERQHKRLH